MGGKSKAPTAPSYGGLIQSATGLANTDSTLATQQQKWGQDQFAKEQATVDPLIQSETSLANTAGANATAQQDYWNNTIQPVETSFVNDANNYDSASNRDLQMGAAQANVAQQYNSARQGAESQLESYGLDPSSTRYAALDLGARDSGAAAMAAAGTTASNNVTSTGMQLKQAAVNMGNTNLSQANANNQLALGATGAATGASESLGQAGGALMGTGQSWNNSANGALGTAASIQNTQYQDQLGQFKANQDASSGLGTLAGGALGMLGNVFQGAGKTAAAPAIAALAGGGVVHPQLSPSGGAIPDDIPAALTANEFVVPQDVAHWIGQKALYGLMDKARTEKAAVGQPQQSALPTG